MGLVVYNAQIFFKKIKNIYLLKKVDFDTIYVVRCDQELIVFQDSVREFSL